MTEEELRDAQKQYLAEEVALAKLKAWTPNMTDVARLVIEVLNDKYSSTTKRDIPGAVDEVMSILQAVNKRLAVPGVWAVPTAAPASDGAIR